MAKGNKKKAKEASDTFHSIMKASVKGNLKSKKIKKEKTDGMEHYPVEKFVGVSKEVFQIRIIDTGMVINAEINLEYLEGDKEKLIHFRTDPYPSDTPISEIREKTKANLQTISIINREAKDAKMEEVFPIPAKDKKK